MGQHFDFVVFLLVVVVCWVRLPGMMFGKPLFALTGIGYSPNDRGSWVVEIVFSTILSLCISMLVVAIGGFCAVLTSNAYPLRAQRSVSTSTTG